MRKKLQEKCLKMEVKEGRCRDGREGLKVCFAVTLEGNLFSLANNSADKSGEGRLKRVTAMSGETTNQIKLLRFRFTK